MKRLFTLLMLLSALLLPAASTYLECGFEEPWEITPKGEHPAFGVRTAPLPEDFTIVEENGNHYLHMMRGKFLAFADFTQGYNIPEIRDFSVSVKARIHERQGGYFVLATYDKKMRLGLSLEKNNGVLVFDANGEWHATGITSLPPVGEWFTAKLEVSVAERTCTASLIRADGTVQKGSPVPCQLNDGLRFVRLGNTPPTGTGCDWDDLK